MTKAIIKRSFKNARVWGAAGAFFGLMALYAAPSESLRQSSKLGESRILFTGDVMLSRQVAEELTLRIRGPWAGFEELFGKANWVGGNFEGAIGPTEECVKSKSPCFATKQETVQLLRRAGFAAVTTENNHAGDLGLNGRAQTRKAFAEAGVRAVDFENSPQFFRVGETAIGVVALTLIPAADGRVQEIPSYEVAGKIRAAKSRADVVIVSIHWGNEYMEWPSAGQQRKAAWLIAQGANVIFGHHPHVIQQPDCVEGKPVFYSLGNHVFDQGNPKTRQGMIADCRVRGGKLRCSSLITETKAGTTFPTLTAVDGDSGSKQERDSKLASCAPDIR
jgi:poly-gamma-glutamate capsule biosynthesis protein CapA/YwtB (metallophosphatase superfamily)